VRRLATVAVLALMLAAAWVGLGTSASGHAALRASDPSNGELLEASPSEISLTFTEPPDAALTIIEVVDASGASVPTGPVRIVQGSGNEVAVDLEDLADSVYTVAWRTVSTVDGHITAGAFSFGVGVTAEEVVPVEDDASQETPAPTPLAVAGRWSLYVGLVILFGGAIAGLLSLGPGILRRRWLVGLAWALAAVGAVVMTLEERRAVGVPLGTLLESDAGEAFVRLGVAVVVAGVAALGAIWRPNTVTMALLAAAAGAAMVARAAGGHAGDPFQVALQGAHFAAAGAWIGGLVWLIVGVRRGAEPERLRRFSNVAAGGLLVLVVTGVVRAANELGGVGWWLHAFDTEYGTTLVVKLAIVVPLVALGAVNRFRNVRRFDDLGDRPLRRTVVGEMAFAAAVLAATAVLTGLPPQGEASATPPEPPPSVVATGSDFATTTRVRLEISPGTVGPNAFVAEVTDFDTGEPVVARRVALSFSLPDRPELDSTLELAHRADGTWRATATSLSLSGTWAVDVLVEFGADSVQVPLEVTPRPPNQTIEVSRAEGQPDLYTITFDGGISIQSYVDPGVAGRTNQVHVTAFDPSGAELTLHHVELEVVPSSGAPVTPDELLMLSPGHAVANVEIEPGTSTFRIMVLTGGGQELTTSFEQTFDAAGESP
jgi:copper transport protein